MLVRLSIKNFALIDKLILTLDIGITVITGETGAGKSIIIDALSVLLGERASVDYIRKGTDTFYLDGIFHISEHSHIKEYVLSKNIELEDDTLIISRSFSRKGKSLILINDQPIPLKVLKGIGLLLADIHGQYANQQLLQPSFHHTYLDSYNEEIKEAFKAYRTDYEAYKRVQKQYDTIQEVSNERARTIDMLHYQLEDIGNSQIKLGEDEELLQEIKKFDNYDHISKVVSQAHDMLIGDRQSIVDQINAIKIELDAIREFDEPLKDISELINSAYFQLEDASHSLSNYSGEIDFDEERYAYCKDRDSLLYELKRKYGPTLEDVVAYEKEAYEKLQHLEKESHSIEQLGKELMEKKEKALVSKEKLQQLRHTYKESLCASINAIIQSIGLEKASIVFEIKDSEELTPLGAQSIELYFAPNKGEGYKELAKIASGGELSRLALAFTCLINDKGARLIVFDEIDVGISGEVAIKVAQQIKALSQKEQVLCITHMPQTVAIADHHKHLVKKEIQERTQTEIKDFTEEEHIDHIGTMITGDQLSKSAYQTALDLIESFKK